MSRSAISSSYEPKAFGIPSCSAAFCALVRSRDAIAVISLQPPFCIPGITFRVAMDATPNTPHFTLFLFIAARSPGTILLLPGTNLQGPLYSMKRGAAQLHYCSSEACRNIFRGVLLCAHLLK